GLAPWRVQHHAGGCRAGPHGERRADVADHGADDVAGPAAVGPIARSAAQTDARGVDGFLTEGTETFSLERDVAVLDLAAGEKRLQPVVGGARQQHAAQDLAALVARERRLDRGATQESIACLEKLAVR